MIIFIYLLKIFLKSNIFYTEDTLVAALQSHANEAYEYLYSNYSTSLYTIIGQFIPDEATANDVLQEVFMAIFKNIDKYDSTKGRLFTWLHTLTRNTAINKLRSKNYKSLQKNDALSDYVIGDGATQQPQFNINSIGLRKHVHLLRADYKNVIELAYFNGYTQEEIAETLDIPIGTVKTRLRNALIELRKLFV